MSLILDYLFKFGFCLESDCPAKKVMKTPNGGNLYILPVPIPVSYLSTLTLPIPSTEYRIISRCPIDNIQVASDSAICTSWFWSASRTFHINSSTALWACLKINMDLRGIEPRQDFSSNSLVLMETQVFLII